MVVSPHRGRLARACGVSLAVGAALVLALGPSAVARTGGATLWVTRYNGPANGFDLAFSVAASPDGSKVFVTGSSQGRASHRDYATAAYDAASGSRLWVSRYNGPGNGPDLARSVAVSPDGSKVFVTGSSRGGTTRRDYATLAYDAATGAMLWVARYNGSADGLDLAYSLAASPDGSKVFVTGESKGTTGFGDATLAYDAATGAKLWVSRYNGPANGGAAAFSVAASPDGSKVFVTGSGYATVSYAASTGAKLWVRLYKGPGGGGSASSVAASPDGSKVFVTGESQGSSGKFEYATVAYDSATGSRLWVRRYNRNAFASSVAVSPDGSKVFVTGYDPGYASSDYATLAYDASTGAKLWVRRYNGPGNGEDDALSVAASPDGSKVFVTGGSLGTTGSDAATVAYDASTGAPLWVRRYNGPANGGAGALSVAASPDGSKVFITGTSVGTTTGNVNDYVTVAYEA